VIVAGGYCKDVYGVVDASTAAVCTYDSLTIVAWSAAAPVKYDTCVQIIHVIEPQSVPLFKPPVIAVLVLSLILIVAISLRKRTRGGG
jgi:hypothetical protein